MGSEEGDGDLGTGIRCLSFVSPLYLSKKSYRGFCEQQERRLFLEAPLIIMIIIIHLLQLLDFAIARLIVMKLRQMLLLALYWIRVGIMIRNRYTSV